MTTSEGPVVRVRKKQSKRAAASARMKVDMAMSAPIRAGVRIKRVKRGSLPTFRLRSRVSSTLRQGNGKPKRSGAVGRQRTSLAKRTVRGTRIAR